MKVYIATTKGAPLARRVFPKKGAAMDYFDLRCRQAPEMAHTLALYRVKPINKETIVALICGTGWAEREEVIAYHSAQREEVAA
jgi:hypothetical protein